MSKRRKGTGTDLSVKSLRLLEAWGVERAMANGATVVPVGPSYGLSDGRMARLAFSRDDEGRMCVGYATGGEDKWEMVDTRPYSVRTLGYFQRRLRRVARRGDERYEDGGVG